MRAIVTYLIRYFLGDPPDIGPEQAADPKAVDPIFLTNEDIIIRLLVRNDGHIWQSEIPAKIDWSPSKTSRVLSGMEERGDIVRRRIGREKVVILSDRLPQTTTARDVNLQVSGDD